MVGGRAFAVAVVVLSTTTAVLLGSGAEAGASRPDRLPGPPQGRPGPDPTHAEGGDVEVESPTTSVDGDVAALDTDPAPAGPTPTGLTPTGPTPTGVTPTGLTPAGPVSVGPTVGGAPATTQGAADTEALVAATAPTPPNGAETAAAWSPVAAVQPDGAAEVEVSAVLPPAIEVPSTAAEEPLLFELLRSAAVVVTDPRPAARGLSPDTTESGALIAILAIVVSLFVVAHQLLDRGDPRRSRARVAEAVARFR